MKSPKEIKGLVQSRIKSAFPKADVLTELGKEELFTQPDGKIIILYDGSDEIDKQVVTGQHIDRNMNFSVHIILQDLKQNDTLMDLIEGIMHAIAGYFPDPDYSQECLKYKGDKAIEFDRDNSLFSHQIQFSYKQAESFYLG